MTVGACVAEDVVIVSGVGVTTASQGPVPRDRWRLSCAARLGRVVGGAERHGPPSNTPLGGCRGVCIHSY